MQTYKKARKCLGKLWIIREYLVFRKCSTSHKHLIFEKTRKGREKIWYKIMGIHSNNEIQVNGRCGSYMMIGWQWIRMLISYFTYRLVCHEIYNKNKIIGIMYEFLNCSVLLNDFNLKPYDHPCYIIIQ